MIETKIAGFQLKNAVPDDVPLILEFINDLAVYEKLEHEVTATEEILRESLFGSRKNAEAVIGFSDSRPAAIAIFFHNFSTFLGKNGIYLEDLFVKPEFRGKGFGKTMIAYLARLAEERDCGRFEWSCLDWNQPSLDFYKSIGAVQMNEWIVHRVTGRALEKLSSEF